MKSGRRVLIALLPVVVLLAACGSKKTTIQGSSSGDLPNNGFPASVNSSLSKDSGGFKEETAETTFARFKDPAGDLGFYNGKKPGRNDAYVDIRHTFVAIAPLNPQTATEVEREIPCQWTSEHHKEGHICQHEGTKVTPGPYIFISLQFAGDVPQENPSPKLSGRYSLFLDLGDNPDTELTATDESPDLASDGADVVYQVVFGNPGDVEGGDPRAVELSVLDLSTDAFLHSTARLWLHENFATWLVPLWEIPGQIQGIRGGAFWGNAANQGEASLGNHDVVPGDQHAPYSFFWYEPGPPVFSVGLGVAYKEAQELKAEADGFLSDLQDAIRSGNKTILQQFLHQAVIDRYGEQRCADYLSGVRDPTRSYTILDISRPEVWPYASDGLTDFIPNVLTVEVDSTIEGETATTDVHLAPSGDGYYWFTDCGDPLPVI